MYYLKMVLLVPIALVWDLFFGAITLIYRGFEWIDKVIGDKIEGWMRD